MNLKAGKDNEKDFRGREGGEKLGWGRDCVDLRFTKIIEISRERERQKKKKRREREKRVYINDSAIYGL